MQISTRVGVVQAMVVFPRFFYRDPQPKSDWAGVQALRGIDQELFIGIDLVSASNERGSTQLRQDRESWACQSWAQTPSMPQLKYEPVAAAKKKNRTLAGPV